MHLVYQGVDYKHRYAAHLADWAPTAEAVGGAQQSFGPSPATVAAVGADLVVAFAGNDHDIYDQIRTAGAWQGGVAHGLGDATLVTPSIAALAAGPELLVVWARTADAQVFASARSAGAWSAPTPVPSALTKLPVAVAAIPGGGAVFAFHGTDDELYWSRFSPGGVPAWSAPVKVDAGGVALPPGSTPALAPGVSGADAEIAWIDAATGGARHARLSGQAFGAIETIGGSGLTRITIATAE